jgi:hypothetical protein
MCDFHKEEYQTLRKEVETAMSELNTLESGALVAAATIFVWLITHELEGALKIGWFIPGILVTFCIFRVMTINRHLGWLAKYLKHYEVVHIQPKLPGWEHFLAEPSSRTGQPRRGFRGKMTKFFWAFLWLATIAAGISGCRSTPLAAKAVQDGEPKSWVCRPAT